MPRASQDFDPLDPGTLETSIFSFDFSGMMAASGETISTVAWFAASLNGIDATPAARLIGAAQIIGTVVLQLIGTGIAGESYRFGATVSTNKQPALTRYAHCQCIGLS